MFFVSSHQNTIQSRALTGVWLQVFPFGVSGFMAHELSSDTYSPWFFSLGIGFIGNFAWGYCAYKFCISVQLAAPGVFTSDRPGHVFFSFCSSGPGYILSGRSRYFRIFSLLLPDETSGKKRGQCERARRLGAARK